MSSKRKRHGRTDELLALLLRARRDPTALSALETRAAAGQIDWEWLIERTRVERISPLLHDTFSEAAFVPSAVAESWQRAYRSTSLNYVVWSCTLSRIATALARADVPFIVLKGAALAETIYEKPTLRPLADIDVLVPRERVGATVEVLQANGYLPPRAAESEGYTLHFENEVTISPRNPHGVAIDLHWSLLDSPYYQRALSHDWFWQSSVPFRGYDGARMLGPEAQLLHLSAHLMLHHHGRGALWLYDIVELLRRCETVLDWDRTFEEAQRCELVQSLQRTVERAVVELGAEIEPNRRAQLSHFSATAGERHVFANPTISVARAEHFWNDIITIANWRTRAAYVAHRLVPSPAFMRQRYGLSGSTWLPLYYAYRWLFGAWRLVGALVSRLARRAQRDTNHAFPERRNHG